MNKYAQAYSINTKLRVAHFLAQIGTESSFRIVEENGSYTAKRMREIFGCKGGSKNYMQPAMTATLGDCATSSGHRKPPTPTTRRICFPMHMLLEWGGDEASGDGYKYRGRGMIQLTGKTTIEHSPMPTIPRTQTIARTS